MNLERQLPPLEAEKPSPESPERHTVEQVEQTCLQQIESDATRAHLHGSQLVDHIMSTSKLPAERLAALSEQTKLTSTLTSIQDKIEVTSREAKDRIQQVLHPEGRVHLPEQAEHRAEKQEVIQTHRDRRANTVLKSLKKAWIVASNGADFIPVIGGVKMTGEAVAGHTLDGQKLTGKQRIVHLGAAIASTALDLTGAGLVEGEATVLALKGAEKAGAKMAEKGSLKGQRICEKTAQFMRDNPQMVEDVARHLRKQAEAMTKHHKEQLPQTT